MNPTSCYGIGVHSGRIVQLTLKPAKANTGIVFVRTDVPNEYSWIPVSHAAVSDTTMSTTVQNQYKVKVDTIEHLMAALWGCGIDNVMIEIDGPEVPIMDGSSKAFVFMIECAGKYEQPSPKKYLKILKDIELNEEDKQIFVSPSSALQINLTIEFTTKAIGKQTLEFLESANSFNNELAQARTFGFLEELNYLKTKGLAQGASLDNAIGIDKDVILNHDGLRYHDEFVRHKALDMLGDLYNAGNIIGKFDAHKTGHQLNNQLLHKIFSDKANYSWVSSAEL